MWHHALDLQIPILFYAVTLNYLLIIMAVTNY